MWVTEWRLSKILAKCIKVLIPNLAAAVLSSVPACGDINNLFLMNDNTCRAAAWAGHVDQRHVTGVSRQSLVLSFPRPLQQAGLILWTFLEVCVDILTRCSHQLARAQTWLMMPGAGVMIMKRSPAALKQPRNWGKLSEDGLFMMGYLHNCNAEVENIFVNARCKPSPSRNDKTCRCPLLPNLPTLQRFPESNWTSRSSSQQQPTFSTGSKLNSRKLK